MGELNNQTSINVEMAAAKDIFGFFIPVIEFGRASFSFIVDLFQVNYFFVKFF